MSHIGTSAKRLKQNASAFLLNPIGELFPDHHINQLARERGVRWRRSVFTPSVTLKAAILQHLSPRRLSSRQVEGIVQSVPNVDPNEIGRADGHDFCQAMKRYPEGFFADCARELGKIASDKRPLKVEGLRIELLDGTTTSALPTPANSDGFGHSGNQHSPSVLAKTRALVRSCAGSGAVLDLEISGCRDGEQRLCWRASTRFEPDALLIGDRGFASYAYIASVREASSHALSRLPTSRKNGQLIERLGDHDAIYQWKQPRTLDQMRPQESLPATQKVRIVEVIERRNGFRDQPLRLVTTLLDPVTWPPAKLAELYRKRWDVELVIRWLKLDHGFGMASAKTPDGVRKQMIAGVVAYNAIRACAALADKEPMRLSHRAAASHLQEAAATQKSLPAKRLPHHIAEMLKRIAKTREPKRKRPPRPRYVLRTKRNYPVKPRAIHRPKPSPPLTTQH